MTYVLVVQLGSITRNTQRNSICRSSEIQNCIDHMQKVETETIFSPVLPPSSVMAVLLSVALLAAPLLGVVPLHRGSRGSLRDDTHMTSALGEEG